MTRHRDNTQALDAFLARKAEIDVLLARLQALSDDHFNVGPDDVNWAHVGTLAHYAELLKRITDSARACPRAGQRPDPWEGEHAEREASR